MKIITEPVVYLVGRQSIDQETLDTFLADHGVDWHSDTMVAGEYLAEVAGRVCYMSFAKSRPGGNSAYLSRIKEAAHGSVLEHAVWNFIFTGISRSCTHELVRHRLASYSQLSQRYVDESVCEVVVPHDLAGEVEEAQRFLNEIIYGRLLWSMPLSDACTRILAERREGAFGGWPCPDGVVAGLCWMRSMFRSNEDYRQLTEYLVRRDQPKTVPSQEEKTNLRKTARQTARSVLPNATETKIFVTMNARAARNALEQRCSRHAEPEIRKLFGQVYRILLAEAPNLFSDYAEVPLPDRTFELQTAHRKV